MGPAIRNAIIGQDANNQIRCVLHVCESLVTLNDTKLQYCMHHGGELTCEQYKSGILSAILAPFYHFPSAGFSSLHGQLLLPHGWSHALEG